MGPTAVCPAYLYGYPEPGFVVISDCTRGYNYPATLDGIQLSFPIVPHVSSNISHIRDIAHAFPNWYKGRGRKGEREYVYVSEFIDGLTTGRQANERFI